MKKTFSSDNYAGVLPEVMEALQAANSYHASSYGADDISREVTGELRRFFEAPEAEVFYVFNGTGANVLCLAAAVESHRSAVVADTSHYYNDESSAPENFAGCRLFAIPADEQGKLQPATVKSRVIRPGDVHYARPAMLSVTQSTEYGTLYQPEELRELGDLCRESGLYFHLDGSRFFNALAALDCAPAAISHRAGVDLLSLGGTKSGMMFGEAVVVFNRELVEKVRYKQKQAMQLHSKTRFISAQFGALLKRDSWRKHAAHSNRMAARLGAGLAQIPGIRLTRPVEANAIFAIMDPELTKQLQERYPFYVWKEDTGEVRLMCAWDTQEAEIDDFLAAAAGK